MFNPDIKYAHSKGVDLPLMYVYLAGYMSGERLQQTMEWRKKIRKYYREWEKVSHENCEKCKGTNNLDYLKNDFKQTYTKCPDNYLAFPISFLDPYNGKEFKTIDKKGLTSSIPANAIYDGDRMSVNKADVIVANMDDFYLETLNKYLPIPNDSKEILMQKLINTHKSINNYRPSIGTIFEICWAMEQRKPVILIVPENKREIYEKHPFTCRASQVVGSVDELLDKKVLETFYRRMAGAIYE